jgi:SAM-dependent methyltransferase
MREILVERLYRLLYTLYYRYDYGCESFVARRLASAAHSWEQWQKKGDIPFSKDLWEDEYSRGQWNYMKQLDEAPRYSVIVGYIVSLKPGGAVLDVGCGEGILFRRLQPYGVSNYLGVDISGTAIRKLADQQSTLVSFVEADAETFMPPTSFDVIVFNEVLTYFRDPIAVFERYAGVLSDGGVLIGCLFESNVHTQGAQKKARSRR